MIFKFRKLVNPPYKENDLVAIFGTLFVLIIIPITILAIYTSSNIRSKAAGNTLIVGSGGYTTINAAISAATSGDIISIKAGTYKEEVNINKPLTVQVFGDGAVWIDGECTRIHNIAVNASGVVIKGVNTKKSNESSIWMDGQNNVTIDGVTIQDYNCSNLEDQFSAGVASWGGGSNLTVKNSTITRRVELPGTKDGFGNGIWLKNTGSAAGGGHLFANNTIVGGYDGIGSEPEDVSWGGFNKNTTIENNTITDCGDDGIQSEGGDQNNIIRYNTIKRCLIGIAFTPALTGPLTVLRNVISEPIERYNLSAAMFKMGDGSVGEVRVYHNSFYAGSEIADGAKQTNANVQNIHFRNNAIYASRYIIETGDTTGTANYDALYTTDSGRFVKWNGSTYGSLTDFRSGTGQEQNGITNSNFGWNTSTLQLNSGSPLINAGTVISGFNDSEVTDGQPDMGAFEFKNAPPLAWGTWIGNSINQIAKAGGSQDSSAVSGEFIFTRDDAPVTNGIIYQIAVHNSPDGMELRINNSWKGAESLAISDWSCDRTAAAVQYKCPREDEGVGVDTTWEEQFVDIEHYITTEVDADIGASVSKISFIMSGKWEHDNVYSNEVKLKNVNTGQLETIYRREFLNRTGVSDVGSAGSRLEFFIPNDSPGFPLIRNTGFKNLHASITKNSQTTETDFEPTYYGLGNPFSQPYEINTIQQNGSWVINHENLPILGDINNDGKVNIFDASIMTAKWGTNDLTADINKDGIVNIFDASILTANWTG